MEIKAKNMMVKDLWDIILVAIWGRRRRGGRVELDRAGQDAVDVEDKDEREEWITSPRTQRGG